MYYRESHGAIICYDITNQESFDSCTFWLSDVEKHAPKDIIKVLCGLKADLSSIREVEYSKGEQFASENGMDFFELSSKNGDNVQEMFLHTANQINTYIYSV